MLAKEGGSTAKRYNSVICRGVYCYFLSQSLVGEGWFPGRAFPSRSVPTLSGDPFVWRILLRYRMPVK